MGVHVLQDEMSYEGICLNEVMICRRKSFVGGYVL